jgi:hypothetical protein
MRTFLLLGIFLSGSAIGCGACLEDKIAAAYDHALIERSVAQRHTVAFFHVEGALAQGEETRRWLAAAAASAPGVDKGSARVALEAQALSVAYDPKRTSLAAVQAGLEEKIATRNLSLQLLREIDRLEHR